ncbi:MAG TPA: DUF167 domain-containing protein [Bacteroidia bacterium]|jgi:uncharacterized protein (TIGR00251 family)
MFLHIKARPNAKQNQLLRLSNGTLQVKIKAPAQGGKANEELLRFLSDFFDIPKSGISVVSGHSAPFKKIELVADEEWVMQKLNSLS